MDSDPNSCAAAWFDGQNALRHEGVLRISGAGGLVLEEQGAPPLAFALDDLRYHETLPAQSVYKLKSNPYFRLMIGKDAPQALLARLPARAEYGRWIDRMGLIRASVVFAIISAAVAAAVITAPDWLGPRIPPSVERRIGDAMIGDLGDRLCHTPQSDAALAKLVNSLDPGHPKVRVGIANIDMVNAVALPGGQVLLFEGLVKQAQSPDEIAGVLAHEIGHVRRRHVMRAILRQFGLSILLAGANSSAVNNVAGIATMGYSRKAEQEADSFAIKRLAATHTSPLGAAKFFDRMVKKYGDDDKQNAVAGWIATHPSAKTRASKFRKSAGKSSFRPALSKAEFAAIKEACAKDKSVKKFELF